MTPRPHRPFQALAAMATAGALVPALLARGHGDPRTLAGAFAGWGLAMLLVAAGGGFVAAATFGRGERPRTGWALLALSSLALVASAAVRGANPEGLFEGATSGGAIITASSILNSGLALAGLAVLARAWASTGLDAGSPAARWAARLAALAVAAALAGPDLVASAPKALAGDVDALGDLLTDVLDGAVFVVAVPVLRAALALGGGLAAWPWALLTLGVLGWLGYDAAAAWGAAAGLSERHVRIAEEIARSGACSFTFAAGIAQRWIMGRPPGGG